MTIWVSGQAGYNYKNIGVGASRVYILLFCKKLSRGYNEVYMISKYSHKDLNWIDIQPPKEEEIAYIFDEYAIPLFIKEEILLKTEDDIIRLDHGFIFVSFYYHLFSSDKSIKNKLIFIVSDNFIITIHDELIESLSLFLKEMELNIITKEKFDINNNRVLFAHLLKNLYINSQNQLIANDAIIKNLKEAISKKNKTIKSLTILSGILLSAIILISILCL